MARLAALKANQDPRSVWNGVTFVDAPKDVAESCYGVELVDDRSGPEFARGDVVIVDPDAEVDTGRVVVAVMLDEQRAYVGRYSPMEHGDTKRFVLTLSNKDHPAIRVDGRKQKGFVVGRVIKHIRDV
jgi:SOS-response transcriptional repressor LexA